VSVPVARRTPERELVEAVAAALRSEGYRTYVDPDGTDYFDLAARKGEEVGLVEGKVAAPSEVLLQALRRRPWADWVGVVVGSTRSARRLLERTSGRRSAVVGVWAYSRGELVALRPPAPVAPNGSADPFAPLRERFRRHLEDLDRGVLTSGIRWSSIPAEVWRASGGRGFREWRLEELDPD